MENFNISKYKLRVYELVDSVSETRRRKLMKNNCKCYRKNPWSNFDC